MLRFAPLTSTPIAGASYDATASDNRSPCAQRAVVPLPGGGCANEPPGATGDRAPCAHLGTDVAGQGTALWRPYLSAPFQSVQGIGGVGAERGTVLPLAQLYHMRLFRRAWTQATRGGPAKSGRVLRRHARTHEPGQ